MAAAPPLGQHPPGVLSPGDQVLVFYNDPTETKWHARILLALIHADDWIILTPDGDIYAEQISGGNPDLIAWRPMELDGSLPIGIVVGQVYGFRNLPDAAAMARLTAEGQRHAAQERARRGLGPAGVVGQVAAHGVGDGGVVVPPLAGGGFSPQTGQQWSTRVGVECCMSWQHTIN